MPNEYRDSREEQIIHEVAQDAARVVMDTLKEDPATDRLYIERIIRKAISGSLELAKEVNPRVGTMTFDQAMEVMLKGKGVARAGWNMDRQLRDGNGSRHQGCFLVGESSVHDEHDESWEFYSPSDEDRAAKDWLIWQLNDLPYVHLED